MEAHLHHKKKKSNCNFLSNISNFFNRYCVLLSHNSHFFSQHVDINSQFQVIKSNYICIFLQLRVCISEYAIACYNVTIASLYHAVLTLWVTIMNCWWPWGPERCYENNTNMIIFKWLNVKFLYLIFFIYLYLF